MTPAIISVAARSGKKVPCGAFTTVPAPQQKEVPTGTGLYVVTGGGLDPLLDGQAGVSEKLKLLPGATGGGATYDLYVYGLFRIGVSSDQACWYPVLLYKGSVAATVDMGAPRSTEALGSTDRLADTITQDTGIPAGQATTIAPGSADGPGLVIVETRGCPYILFQASDVKGFVCVGGL